MSAGEDLLKGLKDPWSEIGTVVKAQSDPIWFLEHLCHVKLFPAQKEILSEFYGKNYKRMILLCGMRSGKSSLASMIVAYEFFKLYVMREPAKKFGLMKNQPIFISVVATSERQAEDAVFANVRSLIEGCEFFGSDVRVKSLMVECRRKNIYVRTLSSWATTAVGRTNKCVVFDELAMFEDTSGKRGAWEVYTRLSKSTDTFGDEGKVIAISSPKHPNDIIMTLYRRHREDPSTLTLLKPTWEMNPNLTREQLMEEYKFDMASFWRDYACQPQATNALQFPEGVELVERNRIMDVDRGRVRVMAIDPAVKNDAFGIAVGYVDVDGGIVVDGVTRFVREDKAYISPTEVREFITDVVRRLNVAVLITDVWMFPELIEYCENELGLLVVKHIVSKADYDRWRELMLSGKLRVCYDEILKEEAESLIVINSRKVDHPTYGSKDVADCVANVIWYLSTQDLPTSFKPLLMEVL